MGSRTALYIGSVQKHGGIAAATTQRRQRHAERDAIGFKAEAGTTLIVLLLGSVLAPAPGAGPLGLAPLGESQAIALLASDT